MWELDDCDDPTNVLALCKPHHGQETGRRWGFATAKESG